MALRAGSGYASAVLSAPAPAAPGWSGAGEAVALLAPDAGALAVGRVGCVAFELARVGT